ncbi:hypothetical protein Scep_001556 [Stephania cephalantha]|uniref:Uncharacterized protein n=1 Tax=Stephania cephalantha TaxID=152367 RepID=A0AAP0LB07_9MAGN
MKSLCDDEDQRMLFLRGKNSRVDCSTAAHLLTTQFFFGRTRRNRRTIVNKIPAATEEGHESSINDATMQKMTDLFAEALEVAERKGARGAVIAPFEKALSVHAAATSPPRHQMDPPLFPPPPLPLVRDVPADVAAGCVVLGRSVPLRWPSSSS